MTFPRVLSNYCDCHCAVMVMYLAIRYVTLALCCSFSLNEAGHPSFFLPHILCWLFLFVVWWSSFLTGYDLRPSSLYWVPEHKQGMPHPLLIVSVARQMLPIAWSQSGPISLHNALRSLLLLRRDTLSRKRLVLSLDIVWLLVTGQETVSSERSAVDLKLLSAIPISWWSHMRAQFPRQSRLCVIHGTQSFLIWHLIKRLAFDKMSGRIPAVAADSYLYKRI